MNQSFHDDMDICYCIALSMNGNAPVECPVITAEHPIGIAECGPCQSNDADAMLRLSARNELVILKTGHAEVKLTRLNREYRLKPDKPIALFKNDKVTIGHSTMEIVKETQFERRSIPKSSHTKSHSYSSSRAYKRILSTLAAIFTLCAVHSNVYGQAPNDDNTLQNSGSAKRSAVQRIVLKNFKAINPPSAEQQDGANPANSIASDVAVCGEETEQCVSNKRYRYTGSRWEFVEVCEYPAYCSKNDITHKTSCQGGGNCRFDSYDWVLDADTWKINKCIDGKWTLHKECSADETVEWQKLSEPKCVKADDKIKACKEPPTPAGECKDGQMKCESEAAMKCQNGKWKYEEICVGKMWACRKLSDSKAQCVRVNERTAGKIVSVEPKPPKD